MPHLLIVLIYVLGDILCDKSVMVAALVRGPCMQLSMHATVTACCVVVVLHCWMHDDIPQRDPAAYILLHAIWIMIMLYAEGAWQHTSCAFSIGVVGASPWFGPRGSAAGQWQPGRNPDRVGPHDPAARSRNRFWRWSCLGHRD